MAKSDLVASINQNVMRSGELGSAGSVVQVTQLAMTGSFVGDFQITDAGRLIVGETADDGSRMIVSVGGMFGYDHDSGQTLGFYAIDDGAFGAGDMVIGREGDNYLHYDQSEGRLGLYSPAGAGFLADSDGSLWVGDTDAVHMRWSSEGRALEIRNGEDVKISLDANGDGFFDGTVYAQGGRIYGNMWVEGFLRVGDVDGPQITIGKFSRESAGRLVETGEIIATDANNLPWFHVTAGGETAGGGWFHLGGSGDYAQRLTFDGSNLVVSGTVYADAFRLFSGGSGVIEGGSTMSNAGKFTAGQNNDVAVIDGEDDTWRIYAGSATPINAPFRVNQFGEVWLENAHVDGVIQVGGEVGGWTIAADYLVKDTGTAATSAGLAPLDYPFYAGATYANRATAPFRVTPAGAITASSGTIAGWALSSAYIFSGGLLMHSTGYVSAGTDNDVAIMSGADATYRFWAGHQTAASAPFRVTKAGAVTATSATITGAITASSGSITGDFYVGASAPRIYIDGTNKRIDSTNYASGSAGFRIEGATGNAEFNNITARGEIATSVFRKGQVVATSGSIYVTRSASIVTEAVTATATTFTLKVKKQLALAPFSVGEIIRIHGETTAVSTWAVVNAGTDGTDHWAYTCYYQSGSNSDTYAVGCAVLSYGPAVTASSTIPNAATATATTFTLDVNEISGAKPFATGSYALLVEGGSSTVCTVDAGSDQGTYWRYTATYVSGSNSNVYNANSPVFGYGTTAPSDGRTMITSDATNSPYISIATHALQPWTAMTERARLGNLTGISGASGYGLWTDNGFFTGTVNASAGSIDGFLTLGTSGGIYQGSGTAASPTTGLKIWNDGGTGRIAGYNSGTVQWYANTDGKLYAGAGAVTLDAAGVRITAYALGGTNQTYNRYRLVDNTDTEIGWIGGYYGAAVNSILVKSDATGLEKQSVLALQSEASADEIAEVNIIAIQGAKNAYVSCSVLADASSAANVVADSIDMTGTTTLDQSSSTAAVPVLKLDQADVSEEMIEFVSTAGTGNAIEAVGSKTLTTTAFIKVTVNGDTRYIPVGTIA